MQSCIHIWHPFHLQGEVWQKFSLQLIHVLQMLIYKRRTNRSLCSVWSSWYMYVSPWQNLYIKSLLTSSNLSYFKRTKVPISYVLLLKCVITVHKHVWAVFSSFFFCSLESNFDLLITSYHTREKDLINCHEMVFVKKL